MATPDSTLRLLIAEESLNDAEMLISVLRNAGHAVRVTRAEDEDSLRDALNEKAFDLFLSSIHMRELPLEIGVEIIQQSGKDIPIIALTERGCRKAPPRHGNRCG
jgi:CheY-like chemotaxis protein